jgi:hypothetical protein
MHVQLFGVMNTPAYYIITVAVMPKIVIRNIFRVNEGENYITTKFITLILH